MRKHTPCKTTNCNRWANLNPDGFCPKCASTEDEDCVGSVCNLCESEIQESDDSILGCDVCHNWYHAKCTGCPEELLQIMDAMSTDDASRLLGYLIWVCPNCNNDSSKTISLTNNACTSVKVPDMVDTGCCTNDKVMVDKGCCTDDKSEHSKPRKVPICKNYRYGKCNDGENCRFSHPAKCLSYCRYGREGCSGGFSNCKLLHPVLCRGSLKYNKCLDPDCTLAHLKGTVRKESNFQTTNSASNPIQNDGTPQLPRNKGNRRQPSNFDANQLGFYSYRQTKDMSSRTDRPVNGGNHAGRYAYCPTDFPSLATDNDAVDFDPNLSMQGQVSYNNSNQSPFLEIMKELNSMKQSHQYFQQEMMMIKSMMGTQRTPHAPTQGSNQQSPILQTQTMMNPYTQQ